MLFFKNLSLILWISLLGFCHAKVEDYLKGIKFQRSFSPIEGKVIDFNISMTDKQYNEMIENAQLSMVELAMVYHNTIPDEAKYSTKVNVNITVDDDIYSFEKVKFKLGGNSSKAFAKVGINLKLKQPFLGRTNLHLRPDFTDISHMRSKLAIDMVNKWNIPTVQETYANVYINGKYFGFYMLLDAIKPGWVTDVYKLPEDEEVKTLYACEGLSMAFNPTVVKRNCINEKDEYLNYTQPLNDMVDEIYEYTSLSQLITKFDNVENIRKFLIYEYLFGATDNFLIGGNNYNLYQKSNGKWEFIPMDYNFVLLLNFDVMVQQHPYQIPKHDVLIDYAKAKFEEWHSPGTRKPFIDILYYNDKKKFTKVLKELLITGFNTDELFARIDELAEFIAPHVERDITPDENGNLPGQINKKGIAIRYTIDDFWNSLRNDDYKTSFGIKKYFQVKFDSVCDIFNFDKSEILRKAKLYRKKRELEANIYDLRQELKELEDRLLEAPKNTREAISKLINKIFDKIAKYVKKIEKYDDKLLEDN